MRTKSVSAARLTTTALLLAVGLVLNYGESCLPFLAVLPGGKLGLANVVTLLAFSYFGAGYALLLGLLRSFLSAVFAGSVTMVLYSGMGTALSIAAMALLRRWFRDKVSIIGQSIMGALFFNLGQVAVSALVLENANVFLYMPVLALLSPFVGLLTGVLAQRTQGAFTWLRKEQDGRITWKK